MMQGPLVHICPQACQLDADHEQHGFVDCQIDASKGHVDLYDLAVIVQGVPVRGLAVLVNEVISLKKYFSSGRCLLFHRLP